MLGEVDRPILTTRPGREFTEDVSLEAIGVEFRDDLWSARPYGRLRENHVATADRRILGADLDQSQVNHNGSRRRYVASRDLTRTRTIRRIDNRGRTTCKPGSNYTCRATRRH